MPRALLVVFTNPSSPDQEDTYNDWYDNTHLDDIVAIPGVVRAQRFRLSDTRLMQKKPWPEHRYLALYELDTDDLESLVEEMGVRENTEAMMLSDALDLESASAFFWEALGPPVERPQ